MTNQEISYDENTYETLSRKEARNVLVTTLNNDSYIAQLDRNLAGITLKENDQGEIVAEKIGNPLLNKQGRREIINILSRYLNKESKLSNIDTNHLNRIMKALAEQVIFKVTIKYKEWKANFSDLDDIQDTVLNAADLALRRSLGAKEMDHVYTDTTKQMIQQQAEQKQTITGSSRKPIFAGGDE